MKEKFFSLGLNSGLWRNNFSQWPKRDLNLGPLDFKSNTLNTQPGLINNLFIIFKTKRKIIAEVNECSIFPDEK